MRLPIRDEIHCHDGVTIRGIESRWGGHSRGCGHGCHVQSCRWSKEPQKGWNPTCALHPQVSVIEVLSSGRGRLWQLVQRLPGLYWESYTGKGVGKRHSACRFEQWLIASLFGTTLVETLDLEGGRTGKKAHWISLSDLRTLPWALTPHETVLVENPTPKRLLKEKPQLQLSRSK